MNVAENPNTGSTGHDAEKGPSAQPPKVFISYSWTTPEYRELVRNWADRIMSDGIEAIIDIYDLKEGGDKYAFMERMATDPTVTHVLVFSDCEYAKKADGRKAGVGAESQIISQEVYNQVDQSKFVPIVCERGVDGQPALPTYLRSRIWIDFSTEQAVASNWEQLIRHVYGKPRYVKPSIGTRPRFLNTEEQPNTANIRGRFASLESAVIENRRNAIASRRDFLKACIDYVDEMRVRKAPQGPLGPQIVRDCKGLIPVRDAITDWVSLEGPTADEDDFAGSLVSLLESLLEMKAPPAELDSWNPSWFDAHAVFVNETFLYLIAALLQCGRYEILRRIFDGYYLSSITERYGEDEFVRVNAFHAGHSDALSEILSPSSGGRYLSPFAELVKRQASRTDISFRDLQESDLLVFVAVLVQQLEWWYPGTLHYVQYGQRPALFVRAARNADFAALSRMFGDRDAASLRKAVQAGWDKLSAGYTQPFGHRMPQSPLSLLNLERWDTLN